MFFFFKQKTAYEMRISDWSSDVCSSDLVDEDVEDDVDDDDEVEDDDETLPDDDDETLPDDDEVLETPPVDDEVDVEPPLEVDEITMLPLDPPPPPKKPPKKPPPNPPPKPPLPPTMIGALPPPPDISGSRSEEHTSELQALMRSSYAVRSLKKKKP